MGNGCAETYTNGGLYCVLIYMRVLTDLLYLSLGGTPCSPRTRTSCVTYLLAALDYIIAVSRLVGTAFHWTVPWCINSPFRVPTSCSGKSVGSRWPRRGPDHSRHGGTRVVMPFQTSGQANTATIVIP
jgi:hypothetical protein